VPFAERPYRARRSVEAVVREVAGPAMREETLAVSNWRNPPVFAYFVDFVVTYPEERSRAEIVEIAYVLQRELHYSYSGPLDSVHLIIRAYTGDEKVFCAIGVGIGAAAAATYLPREKPDDMEGWFLALKAAALYSDRVAREADLAFGSGGDRDDPLCTMANWRDRSDR
jgi:hypothetical protein